MTNPRFSVEPLSGQKLPPGWQRQARQRAEMADAAYLNRLQNAWKGSDTNGSSGNIMRDCRLRQPSWEDIVGQK